MENGLLGFPNFGADTTGNAGAPQSANTVLAGPTSGTNAKPTFRSVVNADITNTTIDLTAKVTGILPSANGGTANGFFAVAGPASSTKTLTLPNQSMTITGPTGTRTYTLPDADSTLAALATAQSWTGQQSFNTSAVKAGILNLTAGTMTATNQSELRSSIHRYDWTNAMVAALSGTTANMAVCTLPAKTIVRNAYVVITSAAGTVTTLTVSLGRTSAAYIDYIVASDAKAAANTVYGDASAERGTNLTGYDMPSFTGTTVVNAQFISTGGNLSTVTTSTGTVYLECVILP